MSFFRSKEMNYHNLIIPGEICWEILNELGEIDALHFIEQEDN